MTLFSYNKEEIKNKTALALGNFDGVHIGHREVLDNALSIAKKDNLTPAVLLFDFHPKKILEKKSPDFLMVSEDRNEMFKKMGFVIVNACFEQIKDMSPYEFLEAVHKEINVKAVCCGFNFRYGAKGAGNAESLCADGEKLGITTLVGSPVIFDGEPVSSTRIREKLRSGDVKGANRMLGRTFSYSFEVVEGDKRGRTMNFPTINQFFPEEFIKPRFGVYASVVEIDGKEYPAVTNIGVRPTIKTESLRSETHIIGYSGQLYYKTVKVNLLEFIRDEMNFGSIEKLTEQITLDVEKAKEIYLDENK